MRYLRQHRPTVSRRTLTMLLCVVVFALLFLSHAVVPRGITNLVYAFGEPFLRAQPVLRTEVHGIMKLFGVKGELVSQILILERQLEKARHALIDYQILLDENRELQMLLGRVLDTDRLIARVLLHPNASPYDTIVIDIGTKSGISLGARVFSSERIYIGTIEQLHYDTARVRLVSSPDVETLVELEGSGTSFTAIGRGGGNMLLEIPRGIEVLVGEQVLLPGLQTVLLGTISSVESHPADAVQIVLFRLPVNIFTLREVFVEL